MKKSSPQYFTAAESLKLGIKGKISVKYPSLTKSFPAHWHEYFEIEIVRDGSACILVNGREYRAGRGDIFFLTPTDFHELRLDNEKLDMINISFASDMLDMEAQNMISRFKIRSAIHPGEEDYGKITKIIDEIDNEIKKLDICYEIVICTLIKQLIAEMIRCSKGEERNAEKNGGSMMQAALSYIRCNLRKPITLAEVAERFYYSPNYFSTLFHREMGMTFKSYLCNARLDLAMKTIRSTDMPVSSICYECGFMSEAHFIRAFKEKYGASPRHFRNVKRSEEKL